MHSTAFFSSAVVLAIVFTLLLALGFSVHAARVLGGAEAVALQAEQATFVRTELELNADRVLQGTLHDAVEEGLTESSAIEARLAGNFLEFIRQTQDVYTGQPSVEFYSVAGPIDYASLRNRFKVVVHAVNGVVFAKFHNAARDFDDTLAARIRFPGYSQTFFLPPNYVAEAVKVGACVE